MTLALVLTGLVLLFVGVPVGLFVWLAWYYGSEGPGRGQEPRSGRSGSHRGHVFGWYMARRAGRRRLFSWH